MCSYIFKIYLILKKTQKKYLPLWGRDITDFYIEKNVGRSLFIDKIFTFDIGDNTHFQSILAEG